MTQQTINVGIAPNTLTGDPLRIAFQKCNANFSDLYMRGVEISLGTGGSSVTDTAAGIYISKTGAGTVTAGYGIYMVSIPGTASWALYDVASTAGIYTNGGLQTAVSTVSALPTCQTSAPSTQGQRRFVTDANSVTFHATVTTGGGSNKVSVICDGTNWYVD